MNETTRTQDEYSTETTSADVSLRMWTFCVPDQGHSNPIDWNWRNEVDGEPSAQVLLRNLPLVIDEFTVLLPVWEEEISSDVANEIYGDEGLQGEEGSLRGGVEAHTIRSNEALVDDEQDAKHDPTQELGVVWMDDGQPGSFLENARLEGKGGQFAGYLPTYPFSS